MIGEQVGSYRITGLIGTGGMGVVYLAEHPLIGQRAAVKILLPQLSHDREVVARFFNEARAAALIKHPGIVSVIDFGYMPGGQAFLVMEHLEGETLGALLESAGPLPERRALRIAGQVAGAVAAAHRKGIVHRDLKPDNIFLVPDPVATGGERVKILDFGIAKLGASTLGGGRGTRTGHVIGSPLYMAPEQCRGGGDLDARADIYSLGCVLFEMIAGCPPLDGTGAGDIIARQIYEAPPTLRSLAPSIGAELDALVARMLAKEPGDRPQSMDEVGVALADIPGDDMASTVPRILPRRTAPSPSPTTLGSSASELRPRPLRARLLLASAGVILIAGAGSLVAMMRTRAPESIVPAAAPAPPPPPPAPVVEPIVAPPPAEVAAPAASVATFTLKSSPPGAAVLRRSDGVRLGVTPYSRREPAAPGALELIVRKSGYRDVRVSLPTDRDGELTVPLRSRDPLDPYAN